MSQKITLDLFVVVLRLIYMKDRVGKEGRAGGSERETNRDTQRKR